jgi:hypothetical protein
MVYEQQAPILLVIGFPSVFTSTSTRMDLGLYLQSVSIRQQTYTLPGVPISGELPDRILGDAQKIFKETTPKKV